MKPAGLWLSPSQLSTFKDCPRCFWLSKQANKLERPRGIFPSLPGGMDLVLKSRYDQFREIGGVPPEIAEQLEGFKLFDDQAFLDRARNWRTGLSTELELASGEKATLGGAIDDLLVSPAGEFAIFDYKTRGSPPKGTGEEYYGHQLDCYALLVYRAKAGNVASEGMLAYYYPSGTRDEPKPGTVGVSFVCEVKRIEVNPKRAADLVERAALCLAGPEPAALDSCEYCAYTSRAAALAATLTDPRR